jgi:putative colanic acid biosynthesis acetyltransferase WcaB
MILFRLASLCGRNKIYYLIGYPYLLCYKVIVGWVFCIEIDFKAQIGKNLSLHHGQGLVVNGGAIIGENCALRQCTTIGNIRLDNGEYSASPNIGNNVDIGSNVCIIGDVKIEDNVKIGAGAVVVKNVSSDCTLVGNPAREIKSN